MTRIINYCGLDASAQAGSLSLRLAVAAVLLCIAPRLLADEKSEKVDFNRQIRPILSNKCFRCHGPDAGHRKADLRLDNFAAATAKRDGTSAVVPGKPDESEVFRRIITADVDERMPPDDSGLKLAADEIGLLRRWIAEGAAYQPHWAFIPPQSPKLPLVRQTVWPTNPIDNFVLARQEAAGLRPAIEADKETLLRRVTLDLTGLPPTPSEHDAFLADHDGNAYEKVV
ncbi:MAG TPA: c-type cytochrome domain-containing protein, partial [Planctomycetaceae bacterium]